MLDTPNRLAELVQRSFPHAYCSDCLARQLDITEAAVRDAAQILAIQRPDFEVIRHVCYSCGRLDKLLTVSRRGPADASP